MKKKVLFIISVLLMITILSSVFVGCKSADEKEKEFYAEAEAAINETTATLETLMDKMWSRAWTSSFVYAYTHYKYEHSRGTTSQKGWVDSVKENGEEIKNEQVVDFMIFDVDYKDSKNYTIKTSVYAQITRADYVTYTDIVKDRDDKDLKVEEVLTYTVKDGVASGNLKKDFNPLEYIVNNSIKEDLIANGISASDNFRIYTHFMRINTRMVYDANGEIITREANDATRVSQEEDDRKYWTGYDADIAYNWENVYGMDNHRLTVLYSKGKQQINSFEIYNEKIIAYYTEKDKVNKELVLKADVVEFEEMVVDFEY